MRTLKFRAWAFHKMQPHKEAIRLMANEDLPNNTPHIIMQFTGLLDKNGREIYEGDIVISKFGDFKPFIIAFGEYPDKKASTNIGFYIVAGGSFDCGFGRSAEGDTECFEVIGNIYENPELLEP